MSIRQSKAINNKVKQTQIRIYVPEEAFWNTLATLKHDADKDAFTLSYKIPTVLSHLEKGTVIYTHFTTALVPQLRFALESKGWRAAVKTGATDDRQVNAFLRGEFDVLIMSSAISTGFDGLQKVSNKMIIVSLPHTDASMEQLLGRLDRLGQPSEIIDVLIPCVYAHNGTSPDQYRLELMQNKKRISDSVVEGIVPVKRLKEESIGDIGTWHQRVQDSK